MWAEGLASTQWPPRPASISRRPSGVGGVEAQEGVPPEGGTPRRVSFSEHRRRCGTVGSSNARNTPPFSSLRVLSYRFPSESVLGSIQSGVSGVSGFWGHGSILGSPSNSHRDIPSLNVTPQVRSSTCQKSRRVPPISPKFQGHSSPPNSTGFSPSQRPLRGGGIMANFRS